MENIVSRTFLKFNPSPRVSVFFILLVYNILGVTVLGFNRSPLQMLLTVVGAVGIQFFYNRIFDLQKNNLLSAAITGLGLCLLVNYGHNPLFALFPIFLSISSKFIFTFKGKHIFNPGLMGVVLSLLLTNEFLGHKSSQSL